MKIFKVFFVLVFGVSIYSCYEREEACLDVLASNYTLTADDACDECCTYPSLQVLFFHRIGDAIFSRDSILTNVNGQEFKINDAQIFLSDFDLKLADENILNVRETAQFETADDEIQELVDDHVVLRPSNTLLRMGTIRENGDVESLSFDMGIDHESISIETGSNIFSVDSLYTEDGYYDISLYLLIGPSLEMNKTVRIFIKKDDARIILEPVDVSKIERVDFGLQVTIDYELLLRDVVIEESEGVQIISDYSIPNNLINLVQ